MFVRVPLLVLASVVACNARHSPIVHVGQGAVQGTVKSSLSGKEYYAFQGVPYAKPPVGKLRFQPPQAPEHWTGVWNASHDPTTCLQYDFTFEESQRIFGSEDCLHVNIYTPQLPEGGYNPKLDVILFIHGGGFIFGTGKYFNPNLLVDRNVILVTINYRVGPIGFLSTEDEVLPGNNGLKDQSAALHWVKRNIASFGGNPESITITGLSAGGASVHYHYLSPLSKGAFTRGISVSGCTFCPWTIVEGAREKALKLGASLGCPTDTSRALVDCLTQRPGTQIVKEVKNFLVWLYNPFSPFGPTVEVAGENPFISKQPYDIVKDGEMQNLPWIATVTTAEGLYPTADFVASAERLQDLNDNFEAIAPFLYDYNYTTSADDVGEITRKIRQFYLGDKAINEDTTDEITKSVSDRMFIADLERAAKLQASTSSAPVYFYEFDYRGKHSLSEVMSGGSNKNFGVSHADDIRYVLDCPVYIANIDESGPDKDMSEFLLDIWTSYAKTGVPSTGRGVTWEPVARGEDLKYLEIKSPYDFSMKTSKVGVGNVDFWDSLPLKEHQNSRLRPGKDEL